MVRRSLALWSAALAASLGWAAPGHSQTKPPDVTVAVATAPDTHSADASSSIDDDMLDYVAANGFSERERRGELAVLTGVAAVSVQPTDPSWVAQRSLAYDQALLNAQAGYVIKQNVRIVADTTASIFKAAGREPPPYTPDDKDPSKIGELVRKLVALHTATIDESLRKLNVNPADYASAPEPQRYLQMRDALTRKGLEQATGELVGLVTVQTFEKSLGSGVYKIGVVAVVSPRMKDLAQQVMTQRGRFPAAPEHAAKLREIAADKSRLVRDFGVRWRYDESGLPVIVSFAQWATDYHGGDPILAEKYRDMASSQAEIHADAQIADFLKGSVNVSRTAETGQVLTEAANRMPDNYSDQEPAIRTLVNAYQSNVRRHSDVMVTGISTLSHWTTKHPDTGQEIIGVIRIWSAADEQASRTLRAQRPAQAAASAPPPPSGPSQTQTGRKLMDASDF